jgi:hypothetical protein
LQADLKIWVSRVRARYQQTPQSTRSCTISCVQVIVDSSESLYIMVDSFSVFGIPKSTIFDQSCVYRSLCEDATKLCTVSTPTLSTSLPTMTETSLGASIVSMHVEVARLERPYVRSHQSQLSLPRSVIPTCIKDSTDTDTRT